MTNNKIKKQENYEQQDFFFFLIPYGENFNVEMLQLLKKKSYKALIKYSDDMIIHFLFFAPFFTNKYQLIVDIIYINFYELICAINKGFYYILKNYIWEKKIVQIINKNMSKFFHVILCFYLELEIFGLSPSALGWSSIRQAVH